MNNIFISHAVKDTQLAQEVAKLIQRADATRQVFVASRPGDISPGQEWPEAIYRELRNADVYLALLTPSSITRPWVWFEIGAAWMSGQLLIPVVAGGLQIAEVPSPVDLRQLYMLQDETHVQVIGRALGLPLETLDVQGFVQRVEAITVSLEGEAATTVGWKGVSVDHDYFAWRGPHASLEDRKPMAEPLGLIDALRSVGLTPHWSAKDGLARAFASGLHQVFYTDRKSFRREIDWGDLVLMVKESSAKNAA